MRAWMVTAVAGCLAVAGWAMLAGPALAADGPGGPVFLSPMGEPFRGTIENVAPLSRWFRAADLDHDGRLTIDEMRRDAARFFATLDADHDGEIDPAELSTYETTTAPEIAALLSMSGHRELAEVSTDVDVTVKDADGYPAMAPSANGSRRPRRHRDADLPLTLLATTEPVATADRNLDRGVSRAEFDAAAQTRFHLLDKDNAGYLTEAGLQKLLR